MFWKLTVTVTNISFLQRQQTLDSLNLDGELQWNQLFVLLG